MNTKSRYRNLGFMAEVLVNIVVFSLSCAILVGVFVRAATLNFRTREESIASTQVYALYETVSVQGLRNIEGIQQMPDGNWMMQYDADWKPIAGEGAVYIIELLVTEEAARAGELKTLQCVARRAADRSIIYRLETAFYLPDEGGAAA